LGKGSIFTVPGGGTLREFDPTTADRGSSDLDQPAWACAALEHPLRWPAFQEVSHPLLNNGLFVYTREGKGTRVR
jgi:hypothetical protein